MHDCFVHAKRPRPLFLVIQFCLESADFPFVVSCAVDLYTAKYACCDTATKQQTDEKVQHSFITSLSAGMFSSAFNASSAGRPAVYASIKSR